jgi:molybdenum cofactor synthesis domain-containing protein
MATAALIIIGNEILSGKFADENGPYLIRRLREIGCDLLRLVVIPDVEDVIADEVRTCSERYDHVFTTGGVGPTHDDVTFPSIAKAFGLPVHRHPTLEAVLRKRMGDACNEAALRMAEIPEGAELWWDGEVRYPLIVVRNVAIFPGVPALFQLKFEAVAHRYSGVPMGTERVWTDQTEPEIADLLTEAAARWPNVAIGSYPRFELSPPRVLVTLESRDPEALQASAAFVRDGVAR